MGAKVKFDLTKLLAFTILIIGFSTQVYAENKLVKIGVGNWPPYYSKDGQSGIFIEVIKEALRRAKIVNYKLIPTGHLRRTEWFERKDLDIAVNLTTPPNVAKTHSLRVLPYSGTIITLKDSSEIKTLSDLAGLSIGSFIGSKTVYGESFAKAMLNAHFTEIIDTNLIPRMLLHGRFDAIALDKYIFLSKLKKLVPEAFKERNYTFHGLLPITRAVIYFHDAEIWKAFKLALEDMQEDGSFSDIFEQNLMKLAE